MPALPFDPVDLAPVLPDVLWAIGIAFVLAVVTSKPSRPPSVEEAMAAMADYEVVTVEDAADGEADGDGS